MSHSFTAVIILSLGRVRRAIRAATRGIRGLCAATFCGERPDNLFPILSFLDNMAPALEGLVLGDKIRETGALRCRASIPTPEVIFTPVVEDISTIDNRGDY